MSRTPAIILTALLICGGALALRALGAFEVPELALYDLQLQLATEPHDDDTPVVVIEIREDDLERWPIPDRRLGAVLELLGRSGATAIGVDLYRNLPVPPGESVLARVLAEDTRIIGVRKFRDARSAGVDGHPVLVRSGRVGFNDLIVGDPDERIRRGLLYQDEGDNEAESSFALKLAELALAAEGIRPRPDPENAEWLRLGPTTIAPLTSHFGPYVGADDAGYQFLIDYAHSTFERWSLGALERGELDPERLRGKVVILGSTAESLPDDSPTPLGLRAGVLLHAHQVDQLLRFARGEVAPLSALPEPLVALLTLVLCAVGCMVASGLRPDAGHISARIAAAGALAVAYVGLATLAYRSGLWVPIATPLLALVAGSGATALWLTGRERTERRQLMNLFSRHVSAEVAEQVWTRRGDFMDGGRPRPQRLDATVLFLDMVGSTQKAEQLDPQTLMEWTNRFMDAMAAEVSRAHGVVDDYFGDGLKATFGVPVPRRTAHEIESDARHALDCALAMRRALDAMNPAFEADGLPTTAMRIGVHSGRVVAGSLGSSDRLKYTVMGDVVVTAARLEQTRDVPHDYDEDPCRILVSEHSLELAGPGYETQKIGAIALSGHKAKLVAHRLLGKPQGRV